VDLGMWDDPHRNTSGSTRSISRCTVHSDR
jgi:hypothetical protein